MKFSTASLIVLCVTLTFSGCLAQDPIPTPRNLDPAATPSAPEGIITARYPNIPIDPNIPVSAFKPGSANTYSEVYVKGRYLAMTFDDGPSAEYTGKLLDELKKRNIKATFFLVGQNVVEYPDLVKRIVAEGHEVANHSWSHPNLGKMSDAAVTREIEKTQDAIVAACGVKPSMFRPPYGSITASQKKWIFSQFGLQTILWSVDPLDWRKPGESVVRSRIVSGARSGGIILAHDIHGSTVNAMPETFDQLIAKGFQFATVSELLAMEEPKPLPTPKVLAKANPTEAGAEATPEAPALEPAKIP